MSIRKLSSVAALVLAVGLAGCGSAGSSTAAATQGSDAGATAVAAASSTDTINIELTTAPVGMHPLKTNDAASTFVTGQIFETLYRRSYDGTSYEPLLAADMPEYSEDRLTVTIPLREGVTFQDGTPFTADAVGYMIDCLKNADYGSQRPSIVSSIESYEIQDDTHIVLHLAYDDGVLVAKLAHTNGAIVNPTLDQSKDLLVDPTGAGTGPYQYVSSVSGSSYDLTAYDGYWGGAPSVKNIHYSVVGDEATAIARLQTGEADLYPTVAIDSVSAAEQISGYTLVNQPSSATGYLALRSNADTSVNPLMANKEFRTALLQAIDFDSYVNSVMNGAASTVRSIVAPSLVGYTSAMDDSYIAYDKEAAKATIDANGWSGQTVTMLTSTREAQQTLAAYIQAQLADVGITLNVVSEEWATFLSDAKEDKAADMIFLTWSNVTGDGQQMLDPNFSTTNGTRVKYNNAEFDTAVENSAETTDLAERQQYMLDAVKMIQGDAVVTPIYVQNTLYCYNSNKFGKVPFGMDGLFYVKDITLA